MKDKTVKELNKFLNGVHMGSATFKDYLNKAGNLELKNELKKIVESFKIHEKAITNRISQLGGNASDSLGVIGSIAETFEKLKLIPINRDVEVCDHAIKAMNMGIKSANKFIDENANMEESIMNYIIGVVKDYDDHLHELNKLRIKLNQL